MGTTTVTPIKPDTPAKTDDGGRGGAGDQGSGGGGWGSRPWEIPARTYRTGMLMGLAAIVMLFAAFTSAMVVRRGVSSDWVSTPLPRILYLNTLILLASSLTLELSRRSLRAGRGDRFSGGLYATLGLGLAFVAGQLTAWRELATRGVYLASNPSSSFFYLLTATHGVHLLGGMAALFYLVFSAGRIALKPKTLAVVEVTAIYWHFMDGLWIYLLLLLMTRL